jgi:ATP-binding cassette subfamily B protein
VKPASDGQPRVWKQRLRALQNLPPVLFLLWNSGKVLVSLSAGMRLVTALIPISILYVSKLIIDAIVAVAQGKSIPHSYIWWLVAAEFFLTAFATVIGRAIDYCDGRLADQFSRNVSLRIMEHAATLDVASFEDPVFYDVLERARVQATDRIAMLHGIGSLMQQTVTLASLAAGIIVYAPWLFLLLVVSITPSFLGESHFAFLGYSLAHSLTPVRRELDYLRVIATSKESAKEVKIFGLARHLRDQFAAATDGLIARNRQLARKRLSAGAALALLGSLGYYAGFLYLVAQTLSGKLSVGSLTFLTGALASSSGQIQAVFSTFASIADQSLFLSDLLQFFAVRPAIQSRPGALPAPRPIRDGFEFQKVWFRYPGTQRVILNDLDFRIVPGERVALVGENGQGKTTFVKLLARLYDPSEGRILLDGIDLREYEVEDLHRQIGVIFQDFMRYDFSARQNIGVGQIDELGNEDRILRAAARSGAINLVHRFPDGLKQMLGKRFEGGVDLSGGEWQKFALARGYMRDAQLMILDEPTAALDALAEYEVFRRFTELTQRRMALLISHRFSTVRMCDRIVVLANGAISEQGTHGQLVARGGRYAEMFEMQAASYR